MSARQFVGSNLLLSLMIRGGYMAPENPLPNFAAWLQSIKDKKAAASEAAAIRPAGKSIAAKAWAKVKGFFGRR